MGQMTLTGKPSKNLQENKHYWQPRPTDKKSTSQIKVTETVEEVRQRAIEEKKCPMCKMVVEKYLDICNGKPNMELCVDCIRKRHEGLGRGPGFTDQGDQIQIVSETTDIEVIPYKNIWRVFDSIMFPNPVFPYCLNTGTKEESQSCFGITLACGQFLINKLGLKEIPQKDVSGEIQYHDADEDDENPKEMKEWTR